MSRRSIPETKTTTFIHPIKRLFRRITAAVINDKRPRLRYSYGWLNNLSWELSAHAGSAERRPHFTWGVIQGAALGRKLGQPRASVIVFGVAGGSGLVCFEDIAAEVSRRIGIGIDVIGFDTGGGLPEITDVRDLPNLYGQGHYAMDVKRLKSRLRSAHLVLGLIKDTMPGFLTSRPAPVVFVSMDVDL